MLDKKIKILIASVIGVLAIGIGLFFVLNKKSVQESFQQPHAKINIEKTSQYLYLSRSERKIIKTDKKEDMDKYDYIGLAEEVDVEDYIKDGYEIESKKSPPSPKIVKIDAVKMESDCEEIIDERSKNECLSSLYYARALRNNDEFLCNNIILELNRDDCIKSIALKNLDTNLCNDIIGEEIRNNCVLNIIEKKAKDAGDSGFCSQLVSYSDKMSCFYRSVDINNEKSCDNVSGENNILCLNALNFNQAMSTGDVSYCEKISNLQEKSSCVGEIGSLVVADLDNDGLSDEEEAFYGTDPQNPDSDGDGYKDGEEVKNGYNPLGAGKL